MNDVRAASWWAMTTSVRSAFRSPVTATTFVVVRRRDTSRRVMYGPSAISSTMPAAASRARTRLTPRRRTSPAVTPSTFNANSGFQKSPYAGSTSTETSQPWERRRCAIHSAARASPADADGRSMAASVSTTSRSSADSVDDLVGQRRVLLQVLDALGLERLDDLGVVVAATGGLVQLLRPQHGRVGVLDPGHVSRDLVAEVRVLGPLDRALGDALDDRRRVLDPHLLRALDVLRTAYAAGVHQVHVEVVVAHQLEEAVALVIVVVGPERVRTRHAQDLARLLGAARRGALRLAEHEVRRCLLGVQLRDRRDDVLVAVEDQQEVRRLQLARVRRVDRRERERRAPVLRVRGVEEVDGAVVVLRDVLEVGLGLGHGAVDRRLVLLRQRERLGEAARLRRVDLAARHHRDEVVLHRERAVLLREGRGGLARARQAHDQADLVAVVGRDDLAAGVQREAAAVVDELVPHPQPALLRLAEVVGVADAGHAL